MEVVTPLLSLASSQSEAVMTRYSPEAPKESGSVGNQGERNTRRDAGGIRACALENKEKQLKPSALRGETVVKSRI